MNKPSAHTKEGIEIALRKSWGLDTTEEPEAWSTDNPSRGQCGATALVVNDLLGGKILLSEVFVENSRVGYHYSNLLEDREHFDPTGDQFDATETVHPPKIVERPSRLPKYGADRYLALLSRVEKFLEE